MVPVATETPDELPLTAMTVVSAGPLDAERVELMPLTSIIGLPAISAVPSAYPADVADNPDSTELRMTVPEAVDTVAELPTSTGTFDSVPLVLDTETDVPARTPVAVTLPLPPLAAVDEPASTPNRTTVPLAPDTVTDDPVSAPKAVSEPLVLDAVTDTPDVTAFRTTDPLAAATTTGAVNNIRVHAGAPPVKLLDTDTPLAFGALCHPADIKPAEFPLMVPEPPTSEFVGAFQLFSSDQLYWMANTLCGNVPESGPVEVTSVAGPTPSSPSTSENPIHPGIASAIISH